MSNAGFRYCATKRPTTRGSPRKLLSKSCILSTDERGNLTQGHSAFPGARTAKEDPRNIT
jgi:hypothetical protein